MKPDGSSHPVTRQLRWRRRRIGRGVGGAKRGSGTTSKSATASPASRDLLEASNWWRWWGIVWWGLAKRLWCWQSRYGMVSAANECQNTHRRPMTTQEASISEQSRIVGGRTRPSGISRSSKPCLPKKKSPSLLRARPTTKEGAAAAPTYTVLYGAPGSQSGLLGTALNLVAARSLVSMM